MLSGFLGNPIVFLTTYLICHTSAGCFDDDAASALAPAASGSWDPTATHALARSTGVHPRRVEEVVGNQGGRHLHAKFGVQGHCSESLSDSVSPRRHDPPSSLFLVQLVMRNSGSCRRIGAYKAALQQECALGVVWLSPGDQLRLTSLIKALEKEDFNPLHRKLPLQEFHFQRVADTSDRSNPHHLLTLLLLYVGHDGLLRAGEIVSGLTTAEVIWSPDRSAMALHFARSKTCLTGPGFLVQFRDRPTVNAVSLMREWWEMMGLRTARTVTLFPKRLSETRFDWSSPISYDSLVTRIKLVAHRLGLSTEDYAGHSLRAGGAADLFIARVPYFIIKRMGRWSSDAAMIYYRHEEDVVKTVAPAFQLVASPAPVGGRGGQRG